MFLFPRSRRFLSRGFTLVELLIVIAIVAILVALVAVVLRGTNVAAERTRTVSNMRQAAMGILQYSAENGGFLPNGDLGTKPDGTGGNRGLIWVNAIAPYIGRPELQNRVINDWGWEGITGEFRRDVWVSGNLLSKQAGSAMTELERCRAKTQDPIGGIGYNVYPSAENGSLGTHNANWGRPAPKFALASITYQPFRLLLATSYDWHLVGDDARAFHRFGRNKAAIVYFDGHVEIADPTRYARAISHPDQLAVGK